MPLPLAIPIGMAAAGIFGQIFGANKSGKALGQAEGIVDQQVSDLTAWYDTEKNKDFLQSNVASSAINRTLEDIEDRNKTIESSAAVTGATDASILAQKGKSQEQFGDVIKSLASYGTAREDRIEGRYRSNISSLMGQKAGLYQQKAQIAGNLGTSAGNLLPGAGELFGLTKYAGGGSVGLGEARNKFGRTASQETSMQNIANSAF